MIKIDEVVSNDEKTILDNNNNIEAIIKYLKSIDVPEKEKVSKELELQKTPIVVVKKENKEKKYTPIEKEWLEIFNKLGGENNE